MSEKHIGEDIARLINNDFGMTKKRTTESLLAHMESLIIEEYDNEKTKQTLFGMVTLYEITPKS